MKALIELWAKHILNGNKSEDQLIIFPENFQDQVKELVANKRAEEAEKEQADNQ